MRRARSRVSVIVAGIGPPASGLQARGPCGSAGNVPGVVRRISYPAGPAMSSGAALVGNLLSAVLIEGCGSTLRGWQPTVSAGSQMFRVIRREELCRASSHIAELLSKDRRGHGDE